MFSIDQNCHSLWDVIPKLHALVRRGVPVRHFVEDVDVAFAAVGNAPGERLRIARERFHPSGGADWGAALFYSEFLGRQPVEIRDWEPFTGLKTNVLARRLGRDLDDLYAELSPGDNWQLIGPSYVGDRDHHRLIGDLRLAEVVPFIRRTFEIARADMTRTFPADDARRRIAEWFSAEEERLACLLAACEGGTLVDLYRRWLAGYVAGRADVGLTSDLFAVGADPGRTALLECFVRQYDRASALYNEAIEETAVKLRPLKRRDGELPFFATFRFEGRLVRSHAFLRDGAVHVAGRSFALPEPGGLPLAAMRDAGIACLAGKAVLLILQVRLTDALAVPYRGSQYLPASFALQRKCQAAGLLPGRLRALFRVRFRLLERMRSLDAVIRLPDYLAEAFGRHEVTARELADGWADLAGEAGRRLPRFRDAAFREQWRRRTFPDVLAQVEALDARRRELARSAPKSAEIRAVWKRIKALQVELLDRTVRQIARDWHVRQIDYWDSRGAVLPWCVALGGEGFYDQVIAQAEICEEQADG